MTIAKGSGKRAAKAKQTRAKILTAAHDLFVEHGYGVTALADVADRAGVAVQTIYFGFGNKRTLLKEVVDVAVAGDDEPVATLDRPWFRQALTAPTVHEQLAGYVDGVRGVLTRVAPITKVLATAVAMDPEVAGAWPQRSDPRYTVHRTAADDLATKPDIDPALAPDDIADILYGLLSPELFLVFTSDRNWPLDKWSHWTINALRTQLCAPAAARG